MSSMYFTVSSCRGGRRAAPNATTNGGSRDRQVLHQEIQCGHAERHHVGAAVVEAGEQVPGGLDRSVDGQPGVTGGIAVAVGRPGGTALAEAPGGTEAGADGPGQVAGEGLAGAAQARRRLDDVTEQALLGSEGVDDGA